MWERRYGFPKPERNESQVRVYTDADIERLVLDLTRPEGRLSFGRGDLTAGPPSSAACSRPPRAAS